MLRRKYGHDRQQSDAAPYALTIESMRPPADPSKSPNGRWQQQENNEVIDLSRTSTSSSGAVQRLLGQNEGTAEAAVVAAASTTAAVDVDAINFVQDEDRFLFRGVRLNDLLVGERLGARRDGGEGFQVQDGLIF